MNEKIKLELANTILGHNDDVKCICALHNNLIASGSLDNTIKIWSNCKCIKAIKEFFSPYYLLEFEPNKLLSSLDNNNINVYNNYEKVFVFQGHTDIVTAMVKLNNLYFASGSCDNLIIIWNFNNKSKYKILKGHKNCIRSIIFTNDILCSVGYDKNIKIWDLNKGIRFSINNVVHNSIFSVEVLNNNKIITGASNKSIQIHDIVHPRKPLILGKHDGTITSLYNMDSKFLISSDSKGIMKIWNLIYFTQIQEIKVNNDNKWINKIILNNSGEVLCCNEDKTIKVYKFINND
jgi:WD40 repeat protein